MRLRKTRPVKFALGADFDGVAISTKGVRVEVSANRSVTIHTTGDVTVTNATPAPANDKGMSTKVKPKMDSRQIGDTMPDGTKYAGVSPETGKPFFVLPADAPLTMKWQQAMKYAEAFEGHGQPRNAFRLAMPEELDQLFEERARIGGFYETGCDTRGTYWTCISLPMMIDFKRCALARRFSDGERTLRGQDTECSVRLVLAPE